MKVHPAFAIKVIAFCAIVHNLCIRNGDILEPLEEALDDRGEQPQQDLYSGEQLHGRITAAMSTLLRFFENTTVVKKKKKKSRFFC